MTIQVTIDYGEGEGEEVFLLPSKKKVCSRCNGEGRILNPSIGEHCYTMEEFQQEFSPEDAEEYFKGGNGIYGVECHVCKGKNVVDVVDVNACNTPELKRILKVYRDQEKDERDYQRECAFELARGC